MLKSAAKVDCCILVVGDDRDYDDDDNIHNLFPCEHHMTTMKMTMPGLVQGVRLTDEDSNDKHNDNRLSFCSCINVNHFFYIIMACQFITPPKSQIPCIPMHWEYYHHH